MRHTASTALSRTLPLMGWCPSSTATAAATCNLLSSVRYASSIRAATPAWDVGAGVLKGPRPGHKGGSDRPSSLTPKPERPRSGSPLASTKRSGASSGGSKAVLGEGAPTSLPRRQLSAELKSSGSAMEVLLAATSALHASNLRNKSTALHAITTKLQGQPPLVRSSVTSSEGLVQLLRAVHTDIIDLVSPQQLRLQVAASLAWSVATLLPQAFTPTARSKHRGAEGEAGPLPLEGEATRLIHVIAGVSGRNLALASASPGEYRCVSSSGGAALATVEEPLFGADRVELVTAASVARLVWAMSSARVKLAEFYDGAAAFIIGNIDAFSVLELSTIARAYSRVSFQSAPLFASIERALLAHKEDVSARDLGSTLAAFANMAPDRSRSLVRGLSVVVRDVAPFMAQEELAKVMWVLGMVCDMRAPSDRVVLEAVVGELRARAATLLPQEARTAHLGASTLHRRLTKQAHELSNSVPGRDALTVLPSLEDLCVLLTKTEAGPDRTPTAWPTTGALARKMVAATVDSSSAPGVTPTK